MRGRSAESIFAQDAPALVGWRDAVLGKASIGLAGSQWPNMIDTHGVDYGNPTRVHEPSPRPVDAPTGQCLAESSFHFEQSFTGKHGAHHFGEPRVTKQNIGLLPQGLIRCVPLGNRRLSRQTSWHPDRQPGSGQAHPKPNQGVWTAEQPRN